VSALGQTTFTIPGSQRTVELRRLPYPHDPTLRAWDAADEYALAYVGEQGLLEAGRLPQRTLVVNDLFGALAVALAERRPRSWSDSVTSHRATAANLERNHFDAAAISPLPSTASPTGPIDLAIIKIPRALALLDDQLRRLAPALSPEAVVVAAGMTKAIHTSTIEHFERHLGPSPTSLARRKARLILPTLDPVRLNTARQDEARHDQAEQTMYELAGNSPIIDLPNVFSRGKLDHGTKILLDYLAQASAPNVADDADLLDLGCGNGILGLSLARQAPRGTVTFVDDSYQAIASAQATAAAWHLPLTQRFLTDRTLEQVESSSVDVVVNNPPFHAHQSRTDAIALAMFDDARRVLRPEGRLLVVGNRHLGYHRDLKRRFTQVTTVASSAKFVVLEARP
jgi:16S rRNA (guanine1207-N2)-methyltransferase